MDEAVRRAVEPLHDRIAQLERRIKELEDRDTCSVCERTRIWLEPSKVVN
jgi:hypothetical protein